MESEIYFSQQQGVAAMNVLNKIALVTGAAQESEKQPVWNWQSAGRLWR